MKKEVEKDKYSSQKKHLREKTVKFGINIKPEIREEFIKCCKDNGTSAYRVTLDFIADYIAKSKKNKKTFQKGIDI